MIDYLAKPFVRIIGAAIILLALIAFLSLRMCSNSRQEAAQARHEAKSAEGYSEAAKGAVAAISARSEAEAELKDVVTEAAKDIANAEGSDQAIPPAARAAALRAACRLPDYRLEPACKVQ